MAQGQQEGGGEVSAEELAARLVYCLVVFLIVALASGAFGYFVGKQEHHQTKAEAVKRGFAEWISDENGNTTFTWKEPTP
jgi:hypothetical protein